jgi:glutamyl-tRNA synthetase
MSSAAQTTRFAPSPTGSLHLGNARTALFNYLAAQASGGRLVLRVEDTDAGRSSEAMLAAVLGDLRWLGLDWQEGPDVGGPHGPYRQSERREQHAQAIARLQATGWAYPCFCSAEELRLARKAQRAAGQPPRYPGTCARLSAAEVAQRFAAGRPAAIRFRVPDGQLVEFADLVHGPQRFSSEDIGDFVIRRTDGTAAFFLANAVDDAAMGITLVLRGADHLANTPRQILLLEALGMPLPNYGHLPLLLGETGAPLSKREGAASLRDLREQGYLPGAICNYLVRLGHVCHSDDWLELADMPASFDLAGTSRSAAHFDEAQLRHWQREAVLRTDAADLVDWLGERLGGIADPSRRREFVTVVRGNVLFPGDIEPLLQVVRDEGVPADEAARSAIVEAGGDFFRNASAAWRDHAPEFRGWTRATGAATGRRGAALYMPLRAALTGTTHGPELAPLVALMGPAQVASRLEAAAAQAEAEFASRAE